MTEWGGYRKDDEIMTLLRLQLAEAKEKIRALEYRGEPGISDPMAEYVGRLKSKLERAETALETIEAIAGANTYAAYPEDTNKALIRCHKIATEALGKERK